MFNRTSNVVEGNATSSEILVLNKLFGMPVFLFSKVLEKLGKTFQSYVVAIEIRIL